METTIQSTANAKASESSSAPVKLENQSISSRGLSRWIAYAVATGLMLLGIFLVQYIAALKTQLARVTVDAARLRESNALVGLHLAALEVKDPAYASAQIIVAWDPYQSRGVVAVQSLPPPPAGQNYQLWVLDPNAQTPISAGLLTAGKPFTVMPVTTANPGFAVTLEPAAGSAILSGPILFAVAPAQ